jgi:hypothetical protein
MDNLEMVVTYGHHLKCECGWTYNVLNDDPFRVAEGHLGSSGTYNHVVSIVPVKFVTGKLLPSGNAGTFIEEVRYTDRVKSADEIRKDYEDWKRGGQVTAPPLEKTQ